MKLDIFIAENLCIGQIRLSKSHIAMLVFFIKKNDSSLMSESRMVDLFLFHFSFLI